jgi:hypothetical protein
MKKYRDYSFSEEQITIRIQKTGLCGCYYLRQFNHVWKSIVMEMLNMFRIMVLKKSRKSSQEFVLYFKDIYY